MNQHDPNQANSSVSPTGAPVATGWWETLFAGLPPRGRDWALILAVAALSVVVSGYHFGTNDQSVYLPYLKHFLDPGLYGGDLLLETIPGQHPLFWRLLAVLARGVPLEPLFLVLHLLATALTVIAVYALAINLFRDRASAAFCLVVVALSVPTRYVPGADGLRLAWPEVTLRSLAFPGLLVALLLALRKQPLWAMALAGLMVNLHPISAAVVGAMVWLAGILVGGQRRRVAWAGPAVFLVCALPMLVDFFSTWQFSALSAFELRRWVELTRMRSGPHLFPGTWPIGCWAGVAAVLAVGARSLVFKRPWTERDRIAVVFVAVVLALWVPATVFSEVVPVRRVILAALFRSSKLAVLVALLYFAHHEGMRFSGRPRDVAVGILALAAFLALRVNAQLWVVFLLGAAHFVPTPRAGDQRTCSAGRAKAAMAVLLGALMLAAGLRVKDRLSDSLAWWGGAPPAWEDIQLWCRDHTPRDAVFLTPPALQGFRCFSERAIVGDYKDGAPHMYNPRSFFEWWRRMQDMQVTPHGWFCGDSAFQGFEEEKMAWLCREYGASYVVVRSQHRLAWPKLYENARYAVYQAPHGGGWRLEAASWKRRTTRAVAVRGGGHPRAPP